ncbi:hypothetical protein NJLHNGOC_02295 [Novacetimonas cocois]|uniref:Uncharacterized protein n=1 Tax=Novacetimonas cocois TaxID=1747507 RepID=A0A365YZZ1_9PROT|nr:hypothetical protein NJLHNGOC_02295 [Novacetimonas cocois]
MVKLFAKSFEGRRLFEKRRRPETFVIFYRQTVFKRFPAPPRLSPGDSCVLDCGTSRPFAWNVIFPENGLFGTDGKTGDAAGARWDGGHGGGLLQD